MSPPFAAEGGEPLPTAAVGALHQPLLGVGELIGRVWPFPMGQEDKIKHQRHGEGRKAKPKQGIWIHAQSIPEPSLTHHPYTNQKNAIK